MIFMEKSISDVWSLLWSMGLIIIGFCFIFKKEVDVGFEGQNPIFRIKGAYAIIVGLIIVIIGIYILLN